MADWHRPFDDPVPLPRGDELRALREAGEYVAALSKADHDKPHWQTAVRELMIAAERGGILMLAEIAMRQALAHGQPKRAPRMRKKAAKRYRIVSWYRGNLLAPPPIALTTP